MTAVPAKLQHWTALVMLIFLLHVLTAQSALAITAKIAKKCGGLTDKAYPPRVPGNPAAGHQNGTSQDVENYFKKCVANGGKVPDSQAPKKNEVIIDFRNDQSACFAMTERRFPPLWSIEE